MKRNLFFLLLIAAFALPACSGLSTATQPTVTITPPIATTLPPATPTPPPTVAPTLAPEQAPWWNESVFYEIFVRSFYDSNGDGIGDFNGITEKLDYLNDGDPSTTTDLGVTGIWLMPIFPSPSYHGYDVTDYYAVNPDYGTLEDFKRLLDEAHQRGIRVIIDMVLNHTSSENPWFKDAQDPSSPYRDWYIWSETDPGTSGPWGEKVWHPSASGGYYYGVFVDTMPDLNYHNPEVAEKMKDVARFWLQDVKVDGFRLDGARYVVEEGKEMADTPGNHAWWKNYRQAVKEINPEALLVGEIWTSSFAVAGYVKSGDELDLAFDFDLASALVKSAGSQNAPGAQNQMVISARLFPQGQMAPFLTNHDMNRVMSVLNSAEKARNAAALLLTVPGVPFIYYGEEIGMKGMKPDEKIRVPMQWSAQEHAGFTSGIPWETVNPDYTDVNVAAQAGDPASLLSRYRDLIHLRAGHPALLFGKPYKVESENPALYALLRASRDEAVLILVNLGEEAVASPALTLDGSPLSGVYQAVTLYGEGQAADLAVDAGGNAEGYAPVASLPENSVLILQLVQK